MPRTFNHLSYEQRCRLKNMLESKTPVQTIADTLGFHRSAIYREIKRGTVDGVYSPEDSENRYQENLSHSGKEAKLSINPELAQIIADYILKDKLSPKKIAAELQKRSGDIPNAAITHNTIYNAIDNGLIPGVTRENLRSDETSVYNNGNIFLAKWLREELDIKDGDILHFEVTADKKIIFSKIEEDG